MATYGWIGLGHMGAPMTANLVKAGHTVRGYDPSAAACAEAERGGVEVVGSLAEVASGADAVFTSLPTGAHVLQVYEAPDGVWANAAPGTLLLDTSTSDMSSSRRCHEDSARRGFRFVDSPVSGGIAGAAAGTLTFMLGGEPEAVADAERFIEPMAGRIIPAGGPTAGLAAKLCNNVMLFVSLLGVAEGSQLARELGLDPKVFYEIASVSSGASWPQKTWYPVPGVVDSAAANHNFDATFRADLGLKDIAIALEAADAAGLHTPAAHLAREQFRWLAEEGLGGKDCSLVVKYVTRDGTVEGYRP